MTDTTGRSRPTVRPRADNTALTKRRDSRDAQGRAPAVPKKIRDAAELLSAVPSQMDYAELARQIGYENAHALRKALALPQTVRFLREYKRNLVEQISMANPAALREVRDTSDNAMARVQAVRTLETMGENMNENAPGRFAPRSPGVTIIIEAPPGSGQQPQVIGPPVIDAEPDEFGPTAIEG